MKTATMLAAVVFALVLCVSASADISPWISYQGVLRDASGNPVSDGDYEVTFRLYDVETGGTQLWKEVHSLSAEGGLIDALLGSIIPLNTLSFLDPYWLSIAIESEPELAPRTPFTTVPYAGHAGFADTCLEGDQDWNILGDDIQHDVGRVGIGPPPVDARLDVLAGDEIAADFSNGSVTMPAIRVDNAGGTVGAFFSCTGTGAMPATPAAVYGYARCGATGGHFYSSSGYGAWVEAGAYDTPAMRVQANGDTTVAEFVGTGGVRVDGPIDVGGFEMATGAGADLVLTSDAVGVGTWKPAAGSDADWTVDGIDNMYAVPSGYVGIGTPTPYGKLHVLTTTGDEGFYLEHAGSPGRACNISRTSVAAAANDILQIQAAAGSADGCQLIEAERGGSIVFQVMGDGEIVGKSGASLSGGQVLVDYTGDHAMEISSTYVAHGSEVLHVESPDAAGTYDGIAVYGQSYHAADFGIGGSFEGGFKGVSGVCDQVGGSGAHVGVYGEAGNTSSISYGVYGTASGTTAYGGFFAGDAHVTGVFTAATKSFKVDHPLDPANRYLVHASIESDEMVNVYSGNVVLDGGGKAHVELPDWFEVINTDFRYQLTAIGAPGPDLFIAEKISDGSFVIGGGDPGMEVSWQVTGVRNDPFAVANRMVVEQDKLPHEVGKYMHPELYGKSASDAVHYLGDRETATSSGLTPREEPDPTDGE